MEQRRPVLDHVDRGRLRLPVVDRFGDGGQGTLATAKPRKTAGSFWPHAPTVWDNVHRAMPFDKAGTLKAEEVYAVVACVLFRNGIVGEKEAMNARSPAKVRMPNRDGFVPDPRPDVKRK